MHSLSRRTRPRAALLALTVPFLLGLAPGVLAAQEAPATLTLEEAIRLARQNNPDFRAQRNDVAGADWAAREAWGSLLPSASVRTGMQYQASGETRLGIFTGDDLGIGTAPSYYMSDYSLGMSYQFDAGTLPRLAQARANQRATEARVAAVAHDLAYQVTRQYLAVLEARERVALRQAELERAEENLKLARARAEVGAAIELDAKQAEVERGRAEVALVQAQNQLEVERLRLIEQIGIEVDREVRLTTELDVFRPDWTEEELLATARAEHPRLRALEAQEKATEAAVKAAKGSYLPSLQLSAGFSGYTRQVGDPDYLIQQAQDQMAAQEANCQFLNQLSDRLTRPLPGAPADCSGFTLTPEQEAEILANNDVFPFGFTQQPFTVSLEVSLPLFQGFTRQRQVEEARIRAEDAREERRAEALRLRTEIVSLSRSLRTQYRTVQLEEQNRAVADDQLALARERYRIGSGSFLELKDAEALKAQADQAYLEAVHTFHETLAALEAAVGQSLRPQETSNQ